MDAERLLTGQLRRVALAGNIVAALECLELQVSKEKPPSWQKIKKNNKELESKEKEDGVFILFIFDKFGFLFIIIYFVFFWHPFGVCFLKKKKKFTAVYGDASSKKASERRMICSLCETQLSWKNNCLTKRHYE